MNLPPGQEEQTVDDVNDNGIQQTGMGGGYGQEKIFQRPQGEEEYPGRDIAKVVPHEEYLRETGGQEGFGGDLQPSGYSNQSGGNPAVGDLEQEPEQALEQEQGYAGVGALGGTGNGIGRGSSSYRREALQPSRSYLQDGSSRPQTISAQPDEIGNGYEQNNNNFLQQQSSSQQQQQQPMAVGGVARQPSFAGTQRTQRTQRTAVTQTPQTVPMQQGQYLEGDNKLDTIGAGEGTGAIAVGTGMRNDSNINSGTPIQQDIIVNFPVL